MRLSIGFLLILTPIVSALITENDYDYLFASAPTIINVLVGLFLLYLFEPLWRMKAIVSLGIGISVREFSNPAFALLSGICVSICVWITQLAVVVGPPLLMLTSGTNNDSVFMLGLCCLLPIWFFGVPALMIFLYERLRDWGLKYAVAYLAREQ